MRQRGSRRRKINDKKGLPWLRYGTIVFHDEFHDLESIFAMLPMRRFVRKVAYTRCVRKAFQNRTSVAIEVACFILRPQLPAIRLLVECESKLACEVQQRSPARKLLRIHEPC